MVIRTFCGICTVVGILVGAPVFGQYDSGSDGSDGMLYVYEDKVVDLRLGGTGAGTGTYDEERWVVIFNYSTIIIEEGVTVTFINHPSGAAVVWLAQSDVTIQGTVNLDGADGEGYPAFSEPGPGGFGGGREENAEAASSGGFGPGGGSPTLGYGGGGGGYGTPGTTYGSSGAGGQVYGSQSIVPLIGGSGGGAGTSGSGGAGGGAILIASSGAIVVDGTITARGGSGGGSSAGAGSGGAIRLIANAISGVGVLDATGATYGSDGGEGRVRLEANPLPVNFSGTVQPPPSEALPRPLFPSSSAPTLHISQIGEYYAPTYPNAGVVTNDVSIFSMAPVPVVIGATNIPVGTRVTVRVVPEQGEAFLEESTPLQGSEVLSTATVFVQFPPHIRSEVQLYAKWTP
jgi:hypothetical protein